MSTSNSEMDNELDSESDQKSAKELEEIRKAIVDAKNYEELKRAVQFFYDSGHAPNYNIVANALFCFFMFLAIMFGAHIITGTIFWYFVLGPWFFIQFLRILKDSLTMDDSEWEIPNLIYNKYMWLYYDFELQKNHDRDVASSMLYFSEFSRIERFIEVINEFNVSFKTGKQIFYYEYTLANSKERPSNRKYYARRYGVLFNVSHFKSISITNKDAIPITLTFQSPSLELAYQSVSTELSDKYIFRAENEMKMAKFLKPAIVNAIITANKFLSKISIEIDEFGSAFITFDDDDIFALSKQEKLRDQTTSDMLLSEISRRIKSDKIEAILSLLKTIESHSDNNFSIRGN